MPYLTFVGPWVTFFGALFILANRGNGQVIGVGDALKRGEELLEAPERGWSAVPQFLPLFYLSVFSFKGWLKSLIIASHEPSLSY